MKLITKITVLVLGLILVAGLAEVVPGFTPLEFQAAAQAAQPNVLTFDLAVDCRTAVGEFKRGGIFMINGKIFPAGTLPSGLASNDPAQPVNGIAPIGDWLVRGHHAFPLPPAVASSYSATPGDFATVYYMFNNARTVITAEGYAFLRDGFPTESLFAVTGGTGGFRGAAGDDHGSAIIGTNATGCPNSRIKLTLVPGSVRGASNN